MLEQTGYGLPHYSPACYPRRPSVRRSHRGLPQYSSVRERV